MPPVASSQQSVYCAWPGAILARSLLSVALTWSAAPVPVTIALPRWLTSKMPTASRTAVCSFTTPVGYSSGMLQPPNSANFAPESDVPVVQRGLQEVGHGANLTQTSDRDPWLECAGDDVPPPQRQPGQDPLRRGRRRSRAVGQGRAPRRRCGGRRGGLRPQAPAPAVDARLHRQARRDRQAAHGRHDLLAAAGDRRPRRLAGSRRDPPRRRRRRAAISNASSVALALPADTPERVRAVAEGFDLGAYTFTAYKHNGTRTARQGRQHRLAAHARRPPAGRHHGHGRGAAGRPRRCATRATG